MGGKKCKIENAVINQPNMNMYKLGKASISAIPSPLNLIWLFKEITNDITTISIPKITATI